MHGTVNGGCGDESHGTGVVLACNQPLGRERAAEDPKFEPVTGCTGDPVTKKKQGR